MYVFAALRSSANDGQRRRVSTFDRHLSRDQPPQDHFERQDVGLVLAHDPERAQSIAPENMKSESARSSSR